MTLRFSHLKRAKVLFFILAMFFFSCAQKSEEKHSTSSILSEDSFKDKLHVKYAKGFDVEYKRDYKILRIINPYKNSNDTLLYVLYNRGKQKPEGFENAQFVEVPIRSFACVYTTHIAFTDILEANDIVKGFASPDYVINSEIRKGLKDGSVKYIGQPDELNHETLISIHPDALMIAGVSLSDMDKYRTLRETGISIIVNAEWRESDPLGRAEWFKLMALFLNKEKLAEEKFEKIEKEYLRLKELTKNIKDIPNVLTGMSFKDTWYVPGGKSFMSQMLKDAGATYPWKTDSSTASAPLNFEAVYDKGLRTDFWVNPEGATSLSEMLKADSRYSDFKAFKKKKVYNNNKRIADNGGNEYWETGIVNPHLILADLISIFHPDLLPQHKLYYYKQLQKF
jgi:iron complex transport system substrate-binding protein